MTASEPNKTQSKGRVKPRRTRRWPGVVAALLLIGAIVAVVAMALTDTEDEAAPTAYAREVPVELFEVAGLTLEETVRGVGTLRAAAAVDIRPEIAGRVRSIAFEEGSAVEAGQVLVEIDDEKLQRQVASRQAALRVAQVRVENARRTFARQEQLMERGVVSADEFDRAQAELDSALAEVDQLEADLSLVREQISDTRIEAPFDGMISQRMVDRGAYVSAGETLARLYQVDPVEIAFSLPERYMGRLQPGQRVAVTVAAFPARVFEGEVDFVSPAIDEATRDFLVKARLVNPEGELMPGGFATAVVTIGEHADRPAVPEESLVATRRGYSVFVVEEGVASMRDVRTGLRREGMVEVLEGVSHGDDVVRRGHLRLSGGDRVRVVEEEAAQAEVAETAPEAMPLAQQPE